MNGIAYSYGQHGSVAASFGSQHRSGFQLSFASRSTALGNSIPFCFLVSHLFRDRREPNNSRNFCTYSLPFSPPSSLPPPLPLPKGRKDTTMLWDYTHHHLSAPSPLTAPQSLCQTEKSEKDKNHMMALSCGIFKKKGRDRGVYK